MSVKPSALATAMVLGASAFATSTQASPITLDLTYSDSGLSATGMVTFDDSLIAAGNFGSNDLNDLSAFSLTVSGPPVIPSMTSFTKADLTGWVLTTNGSGGVGSIFDLNFFMDGDGMSVLPTANADGYSINGVEIFTLQVCDGMSDQANCTGDSAEMWLTNIEVHTVPEPASLALFAVGLAGLGAARRRRVR